MIESIQVLVEDRTKLRLGINKMSELVRLVYEIGRRQNAPFESVLSSPEIAAILGKQSAGYLAKFAGLKKYLLGIRYPNASKESGSSIYFSRLKAAQKEARTYKDKFEPENIFIEDAVSGSALAKNIRKLYPNVKTEIIENLKSYRKNNTGSPLDPKKRDIFVALQRWDFVKQCPCSSSVVACGYHIINLGFGCPYDCSYCYLQQYSNFPGIILDSNIGDFMNATERYLEKYSGKRIRIGTGEFTDSLALDHITGYAGELVSFFSGRNAVLELKTKSANIEGFIGREHKGNTVVSWSLNPPKIAEKEELGVAAVPQRLAAAKKCRQAGFGVGFHFDPIIHYEGWEKDYETVINEMFDAVKDPVWISLGTLRFQRSLKDVIEQRFPASDYIYGELVLGADKKMRYYGRLRQEIFTKIYGWIKKRDRDAVVYLCMEDADMWMSVLGKASPQFKISPDTGGRAIIRCFS